MIINDFKKFFLKYASSYFFRLIFLFIVYTALSLFGVALQNILEIKSHIWLAGGSALACIIIWGYSMWPAIFFATLVLQVFNIDNLIPLPAQLITNIAEPMLTAYFCLRKPGFNNSLNRLEDIVRLFGAAIFSGFMGALISATALIFSINQNLDFLYFVRYWAGHSLGLIMLTPLILVFSSASLISLFEWKAVKKKEKLAFIIAASIAVLLFTVSGKSVWLYFFFPLLPWTSLRFGQQGALLIVLALSTLVIFNTALQPFEIQTTGISNEVQLFIFIIMMQLTGLIMGAGTLERETYRTNREKQLTLEYSELKKNMLLLKAEKEVSDISNQAKTELLANVSHEIRTPLAALLGFTELLITEKFTAEEKKNCIDIIRRNGRQLNNIIDDVLDLSKVQAGKFELQKEAIALDEILNDIKSTVNSEVIKKWLTLTLSTESNVPRKIFTDPLRLRQILINVVGNAIKFTDRGSIAVKVKILVETNGLNKVAFVVTDTGVGIPEDKIKDVFLPFTQVNVIPSRRFGGTGLGLALSQKLAHALGGQIVLGKTTLGQGSEFIITIDPGDAEQIALSEKKIQSLTALEAKTPSNSKILELKKILVVDDNPDNQSLLNYYVRSAGATVDIAADGQEAVQKVHSNQYDIILMDLQMPVMDGYTATRVLRKEGYKKPIIALTAHAMKDVRDRCIAAGFNSYISKPVEKKKLIQALVEIQA